MQWLRFLPLCSTQVCGFADDGAVNTASVGSSSCDRKARCEGVWQATVRGDAHHVGIISPAKGCNQGEAKQRLAIVLPQLVQLALRWRLCLAELQRHLKAVCDNVVVVLHARQLALCTRHEDGQQHTSAAGAGSAPLPLPLWSLSSSATHLHAPPDRVPGRSVGGATVGELLRHRTSALSHGRRRAAHSLAGQCREAAGLAVFVGRAIVLWDCAYVRARCLKVASSGQASYFVLRSAVPSHG